jgi:hypothetical protein
MIVFRSAISATVVHAQIGITEHGTCARDKRLFVATRVAAIMVVHIVGAFFNVFVVFVCACLILWVLMALILRMLAVNAMQMAWLVELTILGRGLAISARVLVARATSFEAAMIAITSRPAVTSRPAIVFPMTRLAVVPLSA